MQLIGTTVFAKRINAKFVEVFGLKMFYIHDKIHGVKIYVKSKI